LNALLVNLEADRPAFLVIDMIEQDLDERTQEALITYLRHRAKSGLRTLFLMTRSSAILDLSAVGPDEAIILCPANHSPPRRVAPFPGAPGYEAVETCLASPDVRMRIARPPELVPIAGSSASDSVSDGNIPSALPLGSVERASGQLSGRSNPAKLAPGISVVPSDIR